MSIIDNLDYLTDTFGDQYTIRMRISGRIRTRFIFQVTVILKNRVVSNESVSYDNALDLVIQDIKDGV